MGKQWDIIDPMTMLGYKADWAGVCFGTSMMAAQAMAIGRLAEFNKRVDFIQNEEMTGEYLCAAITKAQTKAKSRRRLKSIVKKLQEGKEIQLSYAKKFDKEDFKILGETIYLKINNDKFKKEDIKRIEEKLKKYELTKKDQEFLDILSFFEGIELYQQPHYYTAWFNKPVAQRHEMIVAPFVGSDLLKEQEGLSKVYETVNIYTKDSLISYFDKLVQKLKKIDNIGITLGSHNHRISLMYDNKEKKWILLDPNQARKHVDEKHIAEEIQKAFVDDDVDNIVFSTNVFSSGKQARELKLENFFKELDDIPEHVIDEKKTALSLEGQQNVNLLWMASKIGCVDIVEKLLVTKVDVNHTNDTGVTALEVASSMGQLNVVKKLLENRANVDIEDVGGVTPLLSAYSNNFIDVVIELIKNKADIYHKNKAGDSLLFLAVQKNDMTLLSELLETCPSVFEGEENIEAYNTLLHLALKNGGLKTLRILFGKNPKLFETKCQGFTPAFWAIQRKNQESLKFIMEHSQEKVFRQRDQNGNVPAYMAVEFDNIEALKTIAKEDPETLAYWGKDQWTPGMLAAIRGNAEMLQIIFANISKDQRNKDIGYMLQRPDSYEKTTAIQSFLKVFAKEKILDLFVSTYPEVLNVKDENAQTLTEWAVRSGHTDVFEVLLDRDLDILNEEDQYVNTLISLAVRGDQADELKIILNKKPEALEIKDQDGYIPIFAAVNRGALKVIEAIIEKDPKMLEKTNDSGCTPAIMAAKYGSISDLQVMFEHMTDAQIKSNITLLFQMDDDALERRVTICGMLEVLGKMNKEKLMKDVFRIHPEWQKNALFGTPLFSLVMERGYTDALEAILDIAPNLLESTYGGGASPAFDAVKNNRVAALEILIEKSNGNILDEKNYYGQSLAEVAAENGEKEILELLIEKSGGELLEEKNNAGETLLQIVATRIGSWHASKIPKSVLATFEFLMEKEFGKGPLIRNKTITGVIHLALSKKHDRVFRQLRRALRQLRRISIMNGKEEEFSDVKLKSEQYLQALKDSDFKTIFSLHSQGLDIDLPNEEGRTALMVATVNNDVENTKKLLNLGADLHIINAHEDGITPAMMAAEHGHAKVLMLMVDKDPKVLEYKSYTDDDVAKTLIRKGHNDVLELLIETIAGKKLDSANDYFNTMAETAVAFGKNKILELLIEKSSGEVLNYKRDDGMTLVGLAGVCGQKHILELLIERGGKTVVKEKSADGQTPLELTVMDLEYYGFDTERRQNILSCAAILIDNGADTSSLSQERLGEIKKYQQPKQQKPEPVGIAAKARKQPSRKLETQTSVTNRSQGRFIELLEKEKEKLLSYQGELEKGAFFQEQYNKKINQIRWIKQGIISIEQQLEEIKIIAGAFAKFKLSILDSRISQAVAKHLEFLQDFKKEYQQMKGSVGKKDPIVNFLEEQIEKYQEYEGLSKGIK